MRGGDIDLYIETTESDSSILFDKKLKFACNLEQALGEQKIDIVVKMLSQNKSLRIYEEARNTGILLV